MILADLIIDAPDKFVTKEDPIAIVVACVALAFVVGSLWLIRRTLRQAQ